MFYAYFTRLSLIFAAVFAGVVFVAQSAAAANFGIPSVAGSNVEEVLPPSNLRLVESDATSVTVAWTSDVRSIMEFDQAATQTEYTVRVYDKKTEERVKTVVTNDTEATVDGLERNQGYVVRVWAERNGFSSDESILVVRTTPAAPRTLAASVVRRQIFHDVISNKPLNQFGGSSMSKFLAYLSWEAPKGKVRYYTVDIYRAGEDEPVKTVQTKKKFVAVGGLKVGGVFAYQVTSHFNDDYVSEVSERVRFTVSREAVE
jgi:hypothetical protein